MGQELTCPNCGATIKESEEDTTEGSTKPYAISGVSGIPLGSSTTTSANSCRTSTTSVPPTSSYFPFQEEKPRPIIEVKEFICPKCRTKTYVRCPEEQKD